MDFYEQHAYDVESEAIHMLDMKLDALVQQYGEWKSMIFAREQTQAMNSYNPWPVHEPFEHSYNPWPINEPYGNSHNQWSSYEPYDNTYNSEWRNHQDFSWSHNEVNTYEQPPSRRVTIADGSSTVSSADRSGSDHQLLYDLDHLLVSLSLLAQIRQVHKLVSRQIFQNRGPSQIGLHPGWNSIVDGEPS
ncbi:hypothetical protein LWI29_018052 [Acer saccharum]|uniref:Uncharacterized protein n=1 Tax=Acer saccharum TaxID=4024 RepID=A0AA39SE07_ACESA|nr:hypothetical protein LWI29_018052 [Acer saccharum]